MKTTAATMHMIGAYLLEPRFSPEESWVAVAEADCVWATPAAVAEVSCPLRPGTSPVVPLDALGTGVIVVPVVLDGLSPSVEVVSDGLGAVVDETALEEVLVGATMTGLEANPASC